MTGLAGLLFGIGYPAAMGGVFVLILAALDGDLW